MTPWVSDLPCNIRGEGGQSLVIGGSSLVIFEGKACHPLFYPSLRSAKLNLIDLAGSERQHKTRNKAGSMRMKEVRMKAAHSLLFASLWQAAARLTDLSPPRRTLSYLLAPRASV